MPKQETFTVLPPISNLMSVLPAAHRYTGPAINAEGVLHRILDLRLVDLPRDVLVCLCEMLIM